MLKPLRATPPSQANLLWDVIYVEEITHCAAGLKWFIYLHDGAAHEQVVHSFHQVVSSHFYGNLKVRMGMGGSRVRSIESEWVCERTSTPAGACTRRCSLATRPPWLRLPHMDHRVSVAAAFQRRGAGHSRI